MSERPIIVHPARIAEWKQWAEAQREASLQGRVGGRQDERLDASGVVADSAQRDKQTPATGARYSGRAWSDESWRWPAREAREWERDQQDHDDREPDPLGGIYRDDEPQEWRA